MSDKKPNVIYKPAQESGQKRGFTLPTTTSKPPMPQVKTPKKKGE